MLIPIVYSSHQVRSAYVIDTNITLSTISTVCGFKDWLEDYINTT